MTHRMKLLMFPAAAHGHVNPMLPLAQEWVSRGHEVVFYLTQEFESAVRGTGASFRLLDDRFGIPSAVSAGPNLKHLAPKMLAMMNHGLREAPRIAEQARAEQAEGVVYDPMALWGRAISRLLRLPTATFQTTYAMSHSPTLQRHFRKNMKGLPPPKALIGILEMLWISEVLHWRHGLPRVQLAQAFNTVEDFNIVPIPRSYQPDVDKFDERFLFVGPSILPRNDRGDFPLEQLDGRPVLLISLGTTPVNNRPDFYTACFQAFRDSRWQVVMACGRGVDPSTLGPIPSNFLVRQHVPQVEVLQRARVFLTHGGMNSIMEGLWFGVPLAVFPQRGDQLINAARMGELGLGLSLAHEEALRPQVLRDTVERLDTEPGFRSRVSEFQEQLQASGGHRRAADALLQYVSSSDGR